MYDGSPCPSARAYRVSTTAALRRSRDKTDLVILVLCGETDASPQWAAEPGRRRSSAGRSRAPRHRRPDRRTCSPARSAEQRLGDREIEIETTHDSRSSRSASSPHRAAHDATGGVALRPGGNFPKNIRRLQIGQCRLQPVHREPTCARSGCGLECQRRGQPPWVARQRTASTRRSGGRVRRRPCP